MRSSLDSRLLTLQSTQILKIVDGISNAFKNSKFTLRVFIGFSKAFDMLDQPQQLSFIKSYFYSVIRSFWATRLFNHKIRMLLGQQNHRRRQKQLRMSRYISAGHIFNAQNQISFIVCLLETILTPCTRRFNDDITKSSIFEFFRSQK